MNELGKPPPPRIHEEIVTWNTAEVMVSWMICGVALTVMAAITVVALCTGAL